MTFLVPRSATNGTQESPSFSAMYVRLGIEVRGYHMYPFTINDKPSAHNRSPIVPKAFVLLVAQTIFMG